MIQEVVRENFYSLTTSWSLFDKDLDSKALFWYLLPLLGKIGLCLRGCSQGEEINI